MQYASGDGAGVTRRRKIPQNCVKLAWLLCYRWLRGTSQRLFTGILLLHRTRSAADRQLGLSDVNSALTVWEMLRGPCVAPIRVGELIPTSLEHALWLAAHHLLPSRLRIPHASRRKKAIRGPRRRRGDRARCRPGMRPRHAGAARAPAARASAGAQVLRTWLVVRRPRTARGADPRALHLWRRRPRQDHVDGPVLRVERGQAQTACAFP